MPDALSMRGSLATDAALLEIEGLTFQIGQARRIEALRLTLAASERVALTGPSGYGKTTALRMISGLSPPAACARMVLRGESPERLGWPVFRRRVAFVSQRPVMFDESVEANLKRPFAYRSAGSTPRVEWDRQKAQMLFAALGLEDAMLEQNARDLSVGEAQRVALVRALLLEPDVLLLDEPTSALDEASRELVEAQIIEYTEERDAAAVLVSHDRGQRERLCHREIALEDFVSSS